MICHIVLVEVPAGAEQHRQEIINAFRAFERRIIGVVSSDAGTDFSGRCRPYSIAVVMRLEDKAALDTYAEHPDHRQVVAWLDELGCKRIVADFEV